MKKAIPFLIKLSFFSVLVFLIFRLSEKYLPSFISFEGTPWLILYYFLITAVFHFILAGALAKSSKNFIQAFMAASSIKLFLSVLIMFLYAFLNRGTAIPFILVFFILYLLFTLFEILHLLTGEKSGK